MKKKNSTIFFTWLGFIILLFPLLFLEHGSIVLYVYKKRLPFANIFFKWITHLGSIYIYLPFLIYYVVKKDKKNSIGLILVGVLHGIIVNIMKRGFFEWTPRPVKFFEGKYIFDTIQGVYYSLSDSFPSGHTTTTFAFVIYLLLIQKNKFWIPIGFFMAILIGFSRIYLLQHFFVDVYTGAIIGGISAFLVYIFFNNKIRLKKLVYLFRYEKSKK